MENKSEPSRKGDTKLYDISDVIRRICPFFGFEYICKINCKERQVIKNWEKDLCTLMKNGEDKQVMKDRENDLCALAKIINFDRPYCWMGKINKNWPNCLLNTRKNNEKVGENLDKIMVFPKEFKPADKPWLGIPLRTWMRIYSKERKLMKES